MLSRLIKVLKNYLVKFEIKKIKTNFQIYIYKRTIKSAFFVIFKYR